MADNKSPIVKEAGRFESYSGSRLQITLPQSYKAALTSVISGAANPKPNVRSFSSGSIRSALNAIDRQRSAIKAQLAQEPSALESQLDKQFTSETLSYEEYQGVAEQYAGSDEQKEKYKDVFTEDSEFTSYLIKKYGSVENYLEQKKLKYKGSVFNPLTDYVVDVTIISENNKLYKANHISVDELLLESLNGICTFYYIKVDNTSGKTTGTLNSNFIPDDQQGNRSLMFSPISSRTKGPRIIMWDINKQRWNSFYMKNLIKFVRDETGDVE
jgi:hypothetical protein